MNTRVVRAREGREIQAAAQEAARLLDAGEIAAVPTETVYGLACNALDARAAARVFAAKERPSFDPLIVHVADESWIGRLSEAPEGVQLLARKLAAAFWPGPFTMVLPANDAVPDLVRSGLPTVALRIVTGPSMSQT